MFNVKLCWIFFLFFLSYFLISNSYLIRRKRLIGGIPPKADELNYVVAITVAGDYICTGGILGEQHILTAAHCLIDSKTNKVFVGRFKVIAGSKSLDKTDSKRIEIDVSEVYIPLGRNGKPWRISDRFGDIAVLKLEKTLNLEVNKHLNKLNLPSVDKIKDAEINVEDQYINTIAKSGGFGFVEVKVTYVDDRKRTALVEGSTNFDLFGATVSIVSNTDCENHYKYYDLSLGLDHLCGKVINHQDKTPQGLCNGDSGAPLVADNNEVIGVFETSTFECDDNIAPGIFTKVISHIDFVNNAVAGVKEGVHVTIIPPYSKFRAKLNSLKTKTTLAPEQCTLVKLDDEFQSIAF